MRQKFKITFCIAVFLIIFTGLIAGKVATPDQQQDDLETLLPRTAAEDPSLVFYEDFFNAQFCKVPNGWTSNNGGNLRFYVWQDGYYEFTTDCLLLNDDIGGSYAYGYKSFASSVTNGTLEFEFDVENTTSYGSAVKEYHLILRDAGGSTSIITWSLTYTDATQAITVSLQGTAGSKLYSARRIYKVKINFVNSLLDMYVDGALELSGVAYGGQTIQQVYLETTSATSGGFILFDNIEVRASSPVPEPLLYDISPSVDADTSINLDWSDIYLATYKVFRDRKEIFNVSSLTPIASPPSSDYQDTVSGQGTYWYAIVATNASGDSAPSVSKSVRVDFGMPACSWTPILASITPNPNLDGSIDLNWDVPAWPKIYNATDQFTGGTLSPWVNSFGYLNTAATVEQDIGPFARAVRLVDNNNTKIARIQRTFTAQTTGSVEFWVYPTRTDKHIGFALYDTSTHLGPYIKFHSDGNIYAWNGYARTPSLMAYSSHSCYRVRIDYNSSTDMASYYINDTLVASNMQYFESSLYNLGDLNKILIDTGEGESGQDVYVTYFGFTGIGSYDLGDNTYGETNITNYHVYRNTSQITDVSELTPIATVTENFYTDHVTTSGTYWYAIVAANETNSPISNSESVVVDISDVYENGQLFTLDPGAHQVTILDLDGTTILMEFSITVLTTMEMSVTVTPANPASASLLHALRFFIINVISGTYAPSIQVKFHYNDAGLTDAQEGAMGVYYLGPVKWDNVGGAVYKSENCVYITLDHFSTYAVAWVEGENGLPDMVIWVITIGAGVIIIIAIFKLRGGKKGGSGPKDGFEDLFDNFDEV